MKFNEFIIGQQVYIPTERADIAAKIVNIYNLPESNGVCIKLEAMISGQKEEEPILFITEQEYETSNHR